MLNLQGILGLSCLSLVAPYFGPRGWSWIL